MALDESHEDDELFMDRGITYVVSKALFAHVKPITIDYISSLSGSGFSLTSRLNPMGSCSTSCKL